MDKEELLKKLEEIKRADEAEELGEFGTYSGADAHIKADAALLEFINDPRISEAFENIHKWYA